WQHRCAAGPRTEGVVTRHGGRVRLGSVGQDALVLFVLLLLLLFLLLRGFKGFPVVHELERLGSNPARAVHDIVEHDDIAVNAELEPRAGSYACDVDSNVERGVYALAHVLVCTSPSRVDATVEIDGGR